MGSLRFDFSGYSLDVGRRELRRGRDLVKLEPQVFDLLVYLIERRDRVVTKDDLIASVWGGRIVSESTLSSRIAAARKAIGDAGERQDLIRTMSRKGLRFVGEVRVGESQPPVGNHVPEAVSRETPVPQAALRQEVHFCTASDGTQIAYASVGRGLPLVKTANWLNHLEYDWESPVWSPLFRVLAGEYQFVRYDARGNGLSDWDVANLSFDAFVSDLETVVEAVGLKRFALLGISQGAAISIAYAVRHPERVSHLVLYGSFARGRKKRGSPTEIANSDAIITLIRQGWGQENPAFRQLFTSLFIPEGTEEQRTWFNDLQRITTSPENAARLRQTVDDIDVTELLGRVTIPTLVLHCRGDDVQPFDEGRRLAAGIPGARFVALQGRNHIPLNGEPAWSRLLQELQEFLST
jgi:pimeloyl-ACP methyl ester carboxylesterase/DNA-binding winged helix-turn-helix (wHTH) protein